MFERLLSRLGRKESAPQGAVLPRDANPLGPYQGIFKDWVPRENNPYLLEAIREAIPFVDAGLDWLVTLDGIVGFKAETDALQRELDDWAEGVRVNDREQGLQAFYESQGQELYEQGFTVGEGVMSRDGRDLARLVVADSKGIVFRRGEDGELSVWYRPPGVEYDRSGGAQGNARIMRNNFTSAQAPGQVGFAELNWANLVYGAHRPEGGNPYGTSVMRSLPFLARILIGMDVATQKVWERYGDPYYHVHYSAASTKVTDETITKRRKDLAADFSAVMAAKGEGEARDLVTASGSSDEITVKVIGADGQVLEIQEPSRHIEEQMVAKLGLPSWILGFHWSTAERLAGKQAELLLQASKTRFTKRRPGLHQIAAMALRARGMTWRPGDFRATQELPNIADLVARAQANFLDAQADMVRGQIDAGNPSSQEGERAYVTNDGKVVMPGDPGYIPRADRPKASEPGPGCKHGQVAGHKEPFAEDDPELPNLEADTESFLLAGWWKAYSDTLDVLGLEEQKAAKQEDEPVFTFDMGSERALQRIAEELKADLSGDEVDYTLNVVRAWVRGTTNAAAESGLSDAITDRVREQNRAALITNARGTIEQAVSRDYVDDVVGQLADGAYDGSNPKDVARALRQRFAAHEHNWKRIARTEIAEAQFSGKLTQYAENGVEEYDWVTASGACPICLGLQASSPYRVGTGPTPRQDSHPECRCSTRARPD